MKNKIERRNLKTEVRVAGTGDARKIEGYASVFNVPYSISQWWDEFEEIISPVAFNRALAEKQDVRCLFNHDANFILGRSKPGTLQLSVDSTGLAYSCTPPSGPMATHVTDAVERGDVDGASFGFIVIKDTWVDTHDDNGRIVKSIRTILDVDIFDVGPVTFPANDNATAGIRSLWPQGMPAEVRSHFEKRNQFCKCDCDNCVAGMCADCTDPGCSDENCEGEDGTRSAKHARKTRRAAACECACAECRDGKCADCSDADCDDANCTEDRSAHRKKTGGSPPVQENAADPEIEKRKLRLRIVQATLE
jgi:HK97 family phage prohead protease